VSGGLHRKATAPDQAVYTVSCDGDHGPRQARNQNLPDARPGRPVPSKKGGKVTSDEAAAPAQGGTASGFGPLPFDTSKAHQARMYDYLLGGKDNYAADRAAAEEALKIWPDMVFAARVNRAFLGRAVRYLSAQAGIRQFLDLGTGIPAGGSTHQVAQAIAPETRVVYVDYDPVVLAHARALLNSAEAGINGYIGADLRDTGTILGHAAKLLDLTRPTAIMLVAILHVIPEADDRMPSWPGCWTPCRPAATWPFPTSGPTSSARTSRTV
jgi:S-adenosyl methyltransferase